MTIAHHRLLDARRAVARRPVEVVEQAGLATASDDTDVGAQLESEHELRRLLDGIPERQRSVLYLRFVQDLPQREVARILGVSTPAMKMLQARAIRALAQRVRALDELAVTMPGGSPSSALPVELDRRLGS